MSTIAPIKYCPITGNNPLTCTKTGFLAACAKFQAYDCRIHARKDKYHNDYCRICQGEIPANVTFINLAEKIKEHTMGKEKRFQTICYSCNLEKTCSNHYGKPVCSSCMPLRIAAKNYPERLELAMRDFGHKLPTTVPVEASPCVEDYVHINQYDTVRAERDNLQVESEKLRDDLADQDKVIELLKNQIRASADTPLSLVAADKAVLSDLAWTMAEGLLTGAITGISVEDLRTIRNIAQ